MPLAIPLLVVLAAFVAYGSAALARSSSGGLINWLAKQAIITAGGTAWIASQVLKLSGHVTHALGKHFAEVEHAAASWVAALAAYVDLVGRRTLLMPFELSRFAYWLVRHEVPRLIDGAIQHIGKAVHTITKIVPGVTKTIVKLPKLTRAQAKALIGAAVATYVGPYLIPLRWLRAHWHALTVALDHALPVPFGRTVAQIRRRLRRLEKITAGGLAVGVVAMALGRLGLGWLRCRNPGRIGKALCRIPGHWSDDLISLFSDYLILTNICRVLPWLEAGFGEVAAPLVKQLSVAGAGMCDPKIKLPAALDVPTLHLPDVVGV